MDSTTEGSLHTIMHAESSIQSNIMIPSFYCITIYTYSNVEKGDQIL